MEYCRGIVIHILEQPQSHFAHQLLPCEQPKTMYYLSTTYECDEIHLMRQKNVIRFDLRILK